MDPGERGGFSVPSVCDSRNRLRESARSARPESEAGGNSGNRWGNMNKHPANNGKVMLTIWVEAPLRDYVRARAQEAKQLISEWAGNALRKAVLDTSLGAFCFPPDQGHDETIVSALRADRDEWRLQHENAIACWRQESEMWQAKLAALRVAATDAANVLGELSDDGEFSPCPHPSLSGAVRDEIAPWVEAPWRALWAALDDDQTSTRAGR